MDELKILQQHESCLLLINKIKKDIIFRDKKPLNDSDYKDYLYLKEHSLHYLLRTSNISLLYAKKETSFDKYSSEMMQSKNTLLTYLSVKWYDVVRLEW